MNDIIQNTNEAYLSWNLNFFFFLILNIKKSLTIRFPESVSKSLYINLISFVLN